MAVYSASWRLLFLIGTFVLLGALPSRAQVEATPSIDLTDLSAKSELIKERFPDGSIKIERRVIQDSEGNYVHDGAWKQFDRRGTTIAEGQYRNDKRHGTWNRWYRAGDASLFGQVPYNEFSGPFISQANFRNGKLNGKWTIFDAKQRKISEITFVDNQRNGKATWWFANGRRFQQITYRDGVIDGELLQWNNTPKLVKRDTYREGRRIAPKVEYFTGSQKKSEGVYLHAKIVVKTPDDWWNAKFAAYTREGKDEKHGPWTTWHANGQKKQQGEYKNNLPVGNGVWWYENGQKRLQGSFKKGKKDGRWVWWYENGQKRSQGEYTNGHPVGRWAWWKVDGKVAQSANFSASEGDIVTTPRRQPSSSRKAAQLPRIAPAQPRNRFKR